LANCTFFICLPELLFDGLKDEEVDLCFTVTVLPVAVSNPRLDTLFNEIESNMRLSLVDELLKLFVAVVATVTGADVDVVHSVLEFGSFIEV
jgi:hypothetical protein